MTGFTNNKAGLACIPCQGGMKGVSVTVRPLELTFRGDHVAGGPDDKLLKRPLPEKLRQRYYEEVVDENGRVKKLPRYQTVESRWGDKVADYHKPEWKEIDAKWEKAPVSYTKRSRIQIDLKLEVTVSPLGKSANLRQIVGKMSVQDQQPNGRALRWKVLKNREGYITFKKKLAQGVTGRQIVEIKGIVAKQRLPNCVACLPYVYIHWQLKVDEMRDRFEFDTGPNDIYVTYGEPSGKLHCPTDNDFAVDQGPKQLLTTTRLKWACEAAHGTGYKNENKVVDAVFQGLYLARVNYDLDFLWEVSVNNTGFVPKPTLHHYLWLCNSKVGTGQCHNIAAAFVLACRVLGVTGPFEIGLMLPWPSRDDTPPSYPKRGDNVLGKYNRNYEPYRRVHSGEGHGEETLIFLDSAGRGNSFEGVAMYNRRTLYAIGEGRFGKYGKPDKNASCFYARHSLASDGSVWLDDLTKGSVTLCFERSVGGYCWRPYPWKKTRTFAWEE